MKSNKGNMPLKYAKVCMTTTDDLLGKRHYMKVPPAY